jgi:hypothetical protein
MKRDADMVRRGAKKRTLARKDANEYTARIALQTFSKPGQETAWEEAVEQITKEISRKHSCKTLYKQGQETRALGQRGDSFPAAYSNSAKQDR